MDIESSVPASAEELVSDTPFTFRLTPPRGEAEIFKINPLSLRDYLVVEKTINAALALLLYADAVSDKQIAQLLKLDTPTIEMLQRNRSIVEITLRTMEPVKVSRRLKLLVNHIRCNWHSPRRWTFRFGTWLEWQLSIQEVINLASYYLRYCSETKKKIYEALQAGIGSITTEKQTSSPTIEPPSWLDWMSPGEERGGGQRLVH